MLVVGASLLSIRLLFVAQVSQRLWIPWTRFIYGHILNLFGLPAPTDTALLIIAISGLALFPLVFVPLVAWLFEVSGYPSAAIRIKGGAQRHQYVMLLLMVAMAAQERAGMTIHDNLDGASMMIMSSKGYFLAQALGCALTELFVHVAVVQCFLAMVIPALIRAL